MKKKMLAAILIVNIFLTILVTAFSWHRDFHFRKKNGRSSKWVHFSISRDRDARSGRIDAIKYYTWQLWFLVILELQSDSFCRIIGCDVVMASLFCHCTLIYSRQFHHLGERPRLKLSRFARQMEKLEQPLGGLGPSKKVKTKWNIQSYHFLACYENLASWKIPYW